MNINYSDYDSENYSSNEDEDYVPSDDNLSEDDMNECVKEDELDSDHKQSEDQKKKKKRKTKNDIGVRKRKKGGIELQEDRATVQEQQQQKEEEEGTQAEEGTSPPVHKEEEDKKKADDLWASFLSDVGHKAQPASAAHAADSRTSQPEPETPAKGPTGPQKPQDKAKDTSRITITKVFDFAGEEVRVTKEVEADSKEAKRFLKSEEEKPEAEVVPLPGTSAKRAAGLSGVLNRIGGKKQKMSTLEKSRLDWDAFKSEEGITEELATHNRGKEGYLERKNFLERVDQRQFEQEKKLRLNNMKR